MDLQTIHLEERYHARIIIIVIIIIIICYEDFFAFFFKSVFPKNCIFLRSGVRKSGDI